MKSVLAYSQGSEVWGGLSVLGEMVTERTFLSYEKVLTLIMMMVTWII